MKFQNSKKGFTMVEIVLSISLTAILAFAAGIALLQGLNSYRQISTRTNNLQGARHAMDRMVREIIRSGDEPGTNIQNIVGKLTLVDDLGLSATFELDGTDLERNGSLVAKNVTGLTFTGFKDDNSQTNSGPQVRRVRIQMTTLPVGETAPLTLTTDVFIRNYMYENFK